MTSLADQIAARVAGLFLKGTGDDRTRRKFRSAHPKKGEWTIVAAVVAVNEETPADLRVLSIGTGMKVMPDAKIKEKSHGRMVHDCHAEILALRAFNGWLIEECKDLSEDNPMLERTDQGISLRREWKFALYVSELPCGDCSMSNVVHDMEQKGEDTTPWTNYDTEGIHSADSRGRGGFSQLGMVRTKPGRPDSPLSLSKSCSDKISVRQFDGGLLNCISSLLVLPEGFHIKYLVVPRAEARRNSDDLHRCFHTRFGEVPTWFRPIEIVSTDVNFPFSRRDGDIVIDKDPSHLSLVYCCHFCDVLVQGVKDGTAKKGSRPVEKRDQSFVSRASLSELVKPVIDARGSYVNTFKNSERKLRKEELQKTLGHWTKTYDDDFAL
ncbi:unnamed protein product [Kuraishia capsulata CBS 1993]|uniref:A to I editase domain-containing protein n=1 Tax=Kuraishia capsulata CBS 1993 TaxID=1382522 RepID=W6MX23_9ASCO|nr:uncharacterized protein KUCA_T00004126001 [Kuraishia capsulata CBS 1993]CDK28145.1 unnamed protein product [Kuraishia capsulata CBS 1993]